MDSNRRPNLVRRKAAFPHRFRRVRALTLSLSLLVLFAVPLTGMARLDLFGGEHAFFFRQVGVGHAIFAMALTLAGLYLVTFLVNLVAGRLFCGWGCPVGQTFRLADAFDGTPHGRGRPRAALGLAAFSALVAAALLLWLVSPRVFLEGSAPEVAAALGAFAGLAALVVLHARAWRWSFCRRACPIGLYYSVVQTDRAWGVIFDDRQGACHDCGLCDAICPAGLPPRELAKTVHDVGGLAFDGMPATNHCLRCGDCIDICELTFRKRAGRAPMRFGIGIRGKPVDADAGKP